MRRLLSVTILLITVAVAAPVASAASHPTAVSVGAQSPSTIAPSASATYGVTVTFSSGTACTTNNLTVTWSPSQPAGTSINTVSVANSGGTGTANLIISTTTATPGGSYSFTVTASSTNGTNSCNSTTSVTSSGSSLVVVNPTTTTVTSSADPSAPGQSVTFIAKVAPASGTVVPTGTVQFVVDGTNFGAAIAVTGAGCMPTPDACATSPATTTLAAGSHTITATYSATAAISTVTFTVTAGPNNGDIITVGAVTYTWSSSRPPALNGIYFSNNEANAALNLEAAIMGNSSLCGNTSCINAAQTANSSATATATGSVTTITNTTTGAIAFVATFASASTYTIAPTGPFASAFGNSSGTLSGGQQVSAGRRRAETIVGFNRAPDVNFRTTNNSEFASSASANGGTPINQSVAGALIP